MEASGTARLAKLVCGAKGARLRSFLVAMHTVQAGADGPSQDVKFFS